VEKKESQERKTAKGITWDDVEILVIGAGTMGASLAQAYAQSGFNIGLVDVSDEILKRALKTIDGELEAGEKASCPGFQHFFTGCQYSGKRDKQAG